MDIFNFCWLTLLDESKKCSVFFDKNTCNVKNNVDENFNKPVNRISYLYKYGSYNISLFHQCFMEFYTKHPHSSKIIDNFRSTKNLTVCSMSAGPGTDIVGFLYSLFLINKPLVNSAVLKVISRQGSWRNLVNAMVKSSIINIPEASTCNLIECDFLKNVSNKAQGYLKAADILLMCNSLSSSVTPEKVICHTLKVVIQLLKPGALVFFIVSKEKSTYFKELHFFGSFLYGPAQVTLENMPYNEKVADLVGVKPLCSGTSLFAVWKKSHDIQPKISKKETGLAISINNSLTKLKSDVKDINSPILSNFSLKREFSSGDSLGSSSWFSSSSISSPIIKKKDKPVVPDNLGNCIGQNIDFPETNFNNSEKSTSKGSLNTFDPSVRNKNKGSDMNSLLKTFENLITKFERFISSQDTLKNSHGQEKQLSIGEYCHQNMHQGCCRCSVNLCSFNESGSTCCHSMRCYNESKIGNHNYSVSAASNLPQDGPCIVIPLHNLSNESLTHILSLVSQNSSINKTTSTLQPKEEKN